MDIDTIRSTDTRLLEPICEFIEEEGCSVYRSEKFRNFYGGNGIDIIDPGGRSLSEWEEMFQRYFDRSLYQHYTYTFASDERFHCLIQEAEESSYHIDYSPFMFVSGTHGCRRLPEEYEIRRVVSEEEWSRLQALTEESHEDADWYDPSYTGPNRLFEKTRFTSEAIGIDWYYITHRGGEEMLAKLGIFQHRGISRLQDVETAKAYRRIGLASYLVSFAIQHALVELGTAGLALSADRDYHAVDLYRKLGFEEAGESVTLMKYPVKNPTHLQP